jgi:hypothetical protein
VDRLRRFQRHGLLSAFLVFVYGECLPAIAPGESCEPTAHLFERDRHGEGDDEQDQYEPRPVRYTGPFASEELPHAGLVAGSNVPVKLGQTIMVDPSVGTARRQRAVTSLDGPRWTGAPRMSTPIDTSAQYDTGSTLLSEFRQLKLAEVWVRLSNRF